MKFEIEITIIRIKWNFKKIEIRTVINYKNGWN